MANDKWFIKSIEQTLTATGYIIVITTDIPCHLWMRWTVNPPQEHLIQRTKRGLASLVDKYYCFDVYEDNEQEEAGDTLIHTFIKEPWPICETRYFYFHGEIAGVASKSTTAIFKKHRVAPPPAPVTLAFYPDAHPEISSVDGLNMRQVADSTWTSLVTGDGNIGTAGNFNTEVIITCDGALNEFQRCGRGMIVFDTRAIPVGATIQSATLDIYTKAKTDLLAATPGLVLTPCDPASVTDIIAADYQTIQNTLLSDIIPWADITFNTWQTFTLNAAGLLAVTPNGWTKLAIRFHPYDVLDLQPPWVANWLTRYQCRSADTEFAKRPKLTVTYLP